MDTTTSNNIPQGPAPIDPSVNDIILNIDSEPRPSLFKCILFYLLSYIYNNGDGRYKEIKFSSSK